MSDDTVEAQGPEAELAFDFELEAPPEKVWRALTIPAFRDRWLPAGRDGTAAGPAGPVATEVLDAEPPNHLRWRWQEVGQAPGTISFTLTPNDAGGTLLRLVHVRRAAAAPAAANSNAPTMALAA